MTWTPGAIATLERLWGEGLSTAEIARHMKAGQNAIIGKAHRLGLDASRIEHQPRTVHSALPGGRRRRQRLFPC